MLKCFRNSFVFLLRINYPSSKHLKYKGEILSRLFYIYYSILFTNNPKHNISQFTSQEKSENQIMKALYLFLDKNLYISFVTNERDKP